jgi:hypothetical protein
MFCIRQARSYHNFIQTRIGDESQAYLRDTSALRGDYEHPNDADQTMQAMAWESQFDGPRLKEKKRRNLQALKKLSAKVVSGRRNVRVP